MARRFEEGGDHDGINESVEYVKGLIDQELAAGIDLARIVVLGFSQGGHIALKTALNVDGALGGCIALSTMLPSVKAGVRLPLPCDHLSGLKATCPVHKKQSAQ